MLQRCFVIGAAVLPLTAGQAPSASPAVLTQSCAYSSNQGAWDLSPLTLQGSTYVTTDSRDATKTYYYNFCSACCRAPRAAEAGIPRARGRLSLLPLVFPSPRPAPRRGCAGGGQPRLPQP